MAKTTQTKDTEPVAVSIENTTETIYTDIRTLDVVQSPEDTRDWIAETILTVAQYPATLDLRTYCQPIRNQGSQGACAAMAGAAMKEAHEYKDYKLREYLSPQYIYNMRANKTSSGMYMRDLMSILTKYGVCKESTYPYLTTSTITNEITTEANKFRIKGYASIATIDGLKNALFTNGPAVIAVPVYNYGATLWNQEANQTSLGGHAMVILGYTSVGFIIRNSWGTGWGDAGYTIFPYTHWGKQWEIWTTVDVLTGPDKTTVKKSNGFASVIKSAIKRFFGKRGSFVVNVSECRCALRARRD